MCALTLSHRDDVLSQGGASNTQFLSKCVCENAASSGRDTNPGHNFDFECRPFFQSRKFAAHTVEFEIDLDCAVHIAT